MLPIIPFLVTAAKTLGSAALAGGKAAGTAAVTGASKLPGLVSSGIQKGMQSMPQRMIGQSMNVGPTQPSLINMENALRLGKYLYNQNQANLQRQPNQMQMQRPNLQNIIDMYG
jgi:hypothetical protein